MGRNKPILYNALLLTGVNLLLRFVSTSFQVFLSGKIGAEGIGLLQLVLSVGSLAMVAGMGGIRTATMYLCAEVIGQRKREQMVWVLSGCILYSIVLSSCVSFLLYFFSPLVASVWIGNPELVGAVRLVAGFLPVNCLCGVMIGYFTGANRIATLAIVEVMEQLFTMLLTVVLLLTWAGQDTGKACTCVVMGSGLGACFTLSTLLFLNGRIQNISGSRFPVWRKLRKIAIPLAIADDVKAGISTTENLMVPKRLSLYPGEATPLASFGMVCGMVFPVLMFPAALLFGLAELLIPELARCNAAGNAARIRYLAERSFLLTLLYGCFCGGVLFLLSDVLCVKLYNTLEAGSYLRAYAILAPMLYCDIIVDALCKGLGQQKICVRYNIITSALDIALLFVLLPKYGMQGYFISFLVTHLLNFILSLHLLTRLVGRLTQFYTIIFALFAEFIGVLAGVHLSVNLKVIGFSVVFTSILVLCGVIKQKDLKWIQTTIATVD